MITSLRELAALLRHPDIMPQDTVVLARGPDVPPEWFLWLIGRVPGSGTVGELLATLDSFGDDRLDTALNLNGPIGIRATIVFSPERLG